MSDAPQKKSNFRWLSPVIAFISMVLGLYFLALNEPFFLKTVSPAVRGDVPEVAFQVSRRLIGTIIFFVLFNVFIFQTLRQWARYYLSRKLVLSYLFFAIIPLLTNLFIFTTGITTWLGISNTFIVEKSMEMQAEELERFVRIIQDDTKKLETHSINQEEIRRTVNARRSSSLHNLNELQAGLIPVEIYWQTLKEPGLPRYLIPLYLPEPDEDKLSQLYTDETESYEAIYPSWLSGETWTDIVSEEGRLFIRHFSVSKRETGSLVVSASIPIGPDFLGAIQDFQTARVIITSRDGTRVETDTPLGAWYTRLMLKPFASKREVLALNWESGLYEEYGEMRFEIELNEITRILDHDRDLNLFIGGQQETSLRVIILVIVLLILGVLFAIAFGIYLISYITRSLNIIADAHERVREGQLEYRLPYIGRDQLGSMGRSFNNMINSIHSLMTEVSEKQKYQEELRIARDIQMSLLPDVKTLSWCHNIAAACLPAREVGGDYYEVLKIDNDRIGVFIADVSGKGAAAAFYMAELRGVLLALKPYWDQPHALMLRLNEVLLPALAANVFVSAAYLLIDPHTKKGTLARAGHCPAFHVHKDGVVDELMPPGIALGVAKNEVFGKILETLSFPMAAEDKIILYTDGLDEMTNNDEMYGAEQLKSILREQAALNVEELKNVILDDVLSFLAAEDQNDDLTLVVAGLPDDKDDEPRMASLTSEDIC